jgi:Holliday junction resolvase RusA-like endonuclease|tara:strand:- start:1031 stop:1447 length:417 start_codon:yes stop_codon:yes gene_type:complete
MPNVEITVHGLAAPKSIRIVMKNGHPSMANNKKVRAWMDEVRWAAHPLVQAGTTPDKGMPVGIMVDVYLPWQKATPKKLAATTGAHVQKPDADNLLKPIMDALSEAGVWTDDNQVDRIFLQKWRCPRGEERAEITVSW